MEFSKTIKKSGLFYYHRKKLLAKWEEENKAATYSGIKHFDIFRRTKFTLPSYHQLPTNYVLNKRENDVNLQRHSSAPRENKVEDGLSESEDFWSTGDDPSREDMLEDDGTESDNNWPNDDESCDESYSSIETDQYSDTLDKMDLSECITYWALKTNQSHESINLIMEIIRRKTNEKKLPRSARTLLRTSRQATCNIVEIAGGQFWYKGIKQCLSDFFQ